MLQGVEAAEAARAAAAAAAAKAADLELCARYHLYMARLSKVTWQRSCAGDRYASRLSEGRKGRTYGWMGRKG